MRFGLLGTGPWARDTYAPTLAAHPAVEFAGVWGRRPGAARALADAHGVPVFEDADELIGACDAVAVALPPAVQAPLAVRAAGRGRHLLLDKPLAATPEDARAVVRAVDASQVASVVFFTLRFADPSAAWIDEQAAAGAWFTGRADYFGDVFTRGDSPFADSPWRAEKGGLWDVGPHALSVLLPVLGDVTGITAARGPADTVHLVLRHASGASSTAALTLRAPSAGSGVATEFRGEHGVRSLPISGDGPVPALARAVDALLEAVRTGESHPCDVRFAARVTEILAAAEQTLPTGR